MFLHWLFFRREWIVPRVRTSAAFPLPCCSTISHNHYLLFLPVFFCIASKNIFTFHGQHVFNPSLFGVVAALLLGGGLFSSAPAYQWGGSIAMAAFLVTAALALFVFKVGRTPLILRLSGFLRACNTSSRLSHSVACACRSADPGALTSPRFYLFTFYMMTDPKTSPSGTRAQVLRALVIVIVDLWLHTRQSLNTIFFALFLVSAARLLWLHGGDLLQWAGPLPRLALGMVFDAARGGFDPWERPAM